MAKRRHKGRRISEEEEQEAMREEFGQEILEEEQRLPQAAFGAAQSPDFVLTQSGWANVVFTGFAEKEVQVQVWFTPGDTWSDLVRQAVLEAKERYAETLQGGEATDYVYSVKDVHFM